MNEISGHSLIKIQLYALADRPDRRMSLDPVPDVETRSIQLESGDGNSIMQGVAQAVRWSEGDISEVKISLVVTDQRIGFAIPKCPKPTTAAVSIRIISVVEWLFYPVEWLCRYAAETRRHGRQIGLGHIRYEWITHVGSGYQERGGGRSSRRQEHGDIVEIYYRVPDGSSGGNGGPKPTSRGFTSTVNEVYLELAPDLSGEMLALELAARVCRHRIAMFSAIREEPTTVEALRSTLNEIEKDISKFPHRVNPNVRYEIPE